MTIRNRVVLLPHGLSFAQRGVRLPTDRARDYYAARARGGAGLVCLESAIVSLDGEQRVPLILASDPAAVPGYTRIAAAVHAEGAAVCGQLNHYGSEAEQRLTRLPLIAPSQTGAPSKRQYAKPADAHDLERISGDFVRAALNLVEAGFDAIELKAGHDGLIRQFLSPLTNKREDEYGGSAAGRVRFALEIVREIRTAIGSEIALGVRLGINEYTTGGYGVAEAIDYARRFQESGVVDYISATFGSLETLEYIVPPMAIDEGFGVDSFGAVAASVSLPLVAAGRIKRPEHAEKILRDGKASAIGMARELIADPEWPNKAFSGRVREIRPCTACNQLCIGNLNDGLGIGCTVNPWMGFGEYRPSTSSGVRRIVVVGGGPAGLEAARSAAEDGHSVTLIEREAVLGGQVRTASRAHLRADWLSYIGWLENELERLRVDVRLGVRATDGMVLSLSPELVIVATGSRPASLSLEGAIPPDTFLDSDVTGLRVAIVDCGAAGHALWTAAVEAGARGARDMFVVTPLTVVAEDVDLTTGNTIRKDLHGRGARMFTEWVPVGAHDGRLEIQNAYSGKSLVLDVDLVIASAGREVVGSELVLELTKMVRVVVIGDALTPRDVAVACREGQEVPSFIVANFG